MKTPIEEEGENIPKKRSDFYELGNRLFSKEHLQFITKVRAPEVGHLTVMIGLANIQDYYRKKILGIDIVKHPCTLTVLMNTNLELRTSEEGWRSKQVEEILKSHPQQVQTLMDGEKEKKGFKFPKL